MGEKSQASGGSAALPTTGFEIRNIPDFDVQFIRDEELAAFRDALNAPEAAPVTALNDWAPVNQRVRRLGKGGKRRKRSSRTKDETREGFVYGLLKWPLLLIVLGWLIVLSIIYVLTRLYIWAYEQSVTWRGRRETLRKRLRASENYGDWKAAAINLDEYLHNDKWRAEDAYAYYDDATIRRVINQLTTLRHAATQQSKSNAASPNPSSHSPVQDLRLLVEACSKNNFGGVENPRLYSETYYGTKDLAQDFINELEGSLNFLLDESSLKEKEKYELAQHVYRNRGRTAFCLSGGAGFAYYHFGVAKALLDANLLPEVITGTSGGALVAALLGTRTDDELKRLLVPALAHKITACEENAFIWLRRWWRTGARFDSIDWARKCSWFCRGSTTFLEAYERTGRILNITCIPSDPHSPAILANYITAPNAVIWSTVLASAAVPGILNPVVLMMKGKDGKLAPYSFGHKWKDGSLRTDIPLRALNSHFNVNFSIVSQVNPHINLFFFSSRGTVGRPVTHRKGRGWRGGFLGSAVEQYLKLDLTKWLKVLRHLELLPRWMGQDWSELWLQQFSGTITIWPRSRASDFYYILSDPSPPRLAHMIHAGQLSTFPKLLFIENRMKIERPVEHKLRSDNRGTKRTRGDLLSNFGDLETYASEDGSTDEVINTPTSSSLGGRRLFEEIRRQSGVFFDDPEGYDTDKSSITGDYDSSTEAMMPDMHRPRSI